jgi:protein TonB
MTLLLGGVVPLVQLPEKERAKVEELPPRLAKLILEKKQQPPPPPPVVQKPEIKEPKSEPKPKPKAKEVKPQPVKKDPTAARKKAERAGLLAFKDELADLRQNAVSPSLLKQSRLQKTGNNAKKTTRSIITSNASQGSGGINTARLSRDTGGASLDGRAVTQVSSDLKQTAKGNLQRDHKSRKASRSIEEIQLVFDRNKGSIYALYNRALRKDPTLQGKLVLKLTIAPSGKVTKCEIVSSELNSPSLDHKLVARIKLFNFGAKDAEVTVVTYPIEFLPS